MRQAAKTITAFCSSVGDVPCRYGASIEKSFHSPSPGVQKGLLSTISTLTCPVTVTNFGITRKAHSAKGRSQYTVMLTAVPLDVPHLIGKGETSTESF